MPTPPRIASLPSPATSHEKPPRGVEVRPIREGRPVRRQPVRAGDDHFSLSALRLRRWRLVDDEGGGLPELVRNRAVVVVAHPEIECQVVANLPVVLEERTPVLVHHHHSGPALAVI